MEQSKTSKSLTRSLLRIDFRVPCLVLLRDQGAESAGRLVAFQGLSKTGARMAKVAAAGSPKGGSPGRRLVNAEIGAGTGAGRCEGYAQHAPGSGGMLDPVS